MGCKRRKRTQKSKNGRRKSLSYRENVAQRKKEQRAWRRKYSRSERIKLASEWDKLINSILPKRRRRK